MQDYGLLSILPPVLTICIAVYSRNVIVSLALGVLCGSLIITGFNPFAAVLNAVEDQILAEVAVGSQTQVIVTIMTIGGFVNLLERSGGSQAFASRMLFLVSTRIKAQMLTWLAGLSIFFSDSGNSLIIGPLFRPVFDEFRLCREKLAYILDTTSAPICILIPFIGWGAYIMSLIERSYADAGLSEDAFAVLINVLPYQFYAFLALLMVPSVVLTGRDWGPMQRAQSRHVATIESAASVSEEESEERDEPKPPDALSRPGVETDIARLPMGVFFYPLALMLVTILGLISWHGATDGLTSTNIRSSLIIAYLLASLMCAGMMRRHLMISWSDSLSGFVEGAARMLHICIVLVLAWCLSSITADLHTADYLASIIVGTVSSGMFPVVVFVLGAMISLSTGSSYGTFAILMALAVPLGVELGAQMYVTIGAVLSGGLLGDHLSPISDTTVLASAGADCSHIDHVTTQAGYAGFAALVSLFAYLAAGYYPSAMVLVGAIAILLVSVPVAMRWLARPPVSV